MLSTKNLMKASAFIMLVVFFAAVIFVAGCGGGGGGGSSGGGDPTSSPTISPTASPTGTGTIKGIVYDQNGDSLEGATVGWDLNKNSTTSKTTTTDSNGNYTLTGVPSGDQIITAVKGNYAVSVLVNVQNVTITVNLNVDPIGTVTGYVYDADTGTAIANATVSVKVDNWNVTLTTTTDSSGKYTIPYVEEGSHKITSVKSGYTTKEEKVEVFTGQTTNKDFNLTPTSSPTPTPTPSPSPSPSATPSPSPSPTPSPSPEKATVNIWVVERGTPNPVSNVFAQFHQAGYPIYDPQYTNNNGYAQFTNIEPGNYGMVLDKDGYYYTFYPLQIIAGENNFTLELEKL